MHPRVRAVAAATSVAEKPRSGKGRGFFMGPADLSRTYIRPIRTRIITMIKMMPSVPPG